MPMPFHCHECDCPTMNEDGICDCCVKRKENMVTSNKIGGAMVTSIEEENEPEESD